MASVETPLHPSSAPPAAPGQGPSPERILDTLFGVLKANVLKAAIDLDVFTALADGSRTSAEIANQVGASERGTRILCDYLTVHGFLQKEGGSYSLVPDTAAYLNRKSP